MRSTIVGDPPSALGNGPASALALRLTRPRDRPSRLDLVGVRAVARRQVLEGHVPEALLALPDVAELVREKVVRDVGALQQDRPPERVARVTAQERETEEPRRDDDADPVGADGCRVVVEPVEPRLRSVEARAEVVLASQLALPAGASTMTGLPS